MEKNREVVRQFSDELGRLQRKLEDVQQIQRRGDSYGPRGDNTRTGFFPDRGGSGSYGEYGGPSTGVIDAMRRAHEAVTATMKEEWTSLKETWAQADAYQASMSRLNTEYQKRISLERDVAATGMNVVRAQTETTSAMKEAAGTAANLREHYGAIVDLQNELARGAGAASTIFGGPSGPAGYTGSAASDLAGLVALAKASGGGGGDGGGGFGAFLGAAAGKFRPSNIFGGATGTLAAAHMATMLTMEVASQVIPALVAAGAAAAVGLQGGVAAAQRGQGIYAAGESLGGAYGVTPGSRSGWAAATRTPRTRRPAACTGSAAAHALASSGTGQGAPRAGGMGVQTIAMVDRGIANMVLHDRMKQVTARGGRGNRGSAAFGDIGGTSGTRC